jgi:hypothetical protein
MAYERVRPSLLVHLLDKRVKGLDPAIRQASNREAGFTPPQPTHNSRPIDRGYALPLVVVGCSSKQR